MSRLESLAKIRIILPAVLVSLLAGLALGFWMPRDDDFFSLRKNFSIFGALYEEISTGYVDPINPEELMRTGIDAMLRTLDPYTVFIDEADNQDIDIMTRGRYGGVGLGIGMRNGRITVTSPMEGYSGFRQGVRTGDVITHIDDKPLDGLSVVDVRNFLRGDPGTAVELRIEREGEVEPLDFILTRQEVRLRNVTYSGFVNDDTTSGLGYLRLERFSQDAGREVRQALLSLRETEMLQGLILDLRDNPGGMLDAAVEIAGYFVPANSVIVSTRGRSVESQREYRSSGSPILPDTPMIVLVNGNSASASEIVAGAVQDLDRGIILGQQTFGKGLVQVIKSLPYNTSLKMTTSKYFTPSGRSIQSIEYTHREEDGYAVVIEDSLRRAFETFGGRTVRDGGGIDPDVPVSPGGLSELESALFRRSAFFFFANRIAARESAIDEGFEVTSEMLNEFEGWLDEQDFTYQTDAERTVDSLSQHLKRAGYVESLAGIEEIRDVLKSEKHADFQRHSDELKDHLRSEILARYLGERAQIRTSLNTDRQFREAVEYLSDAQAYEAVIAGS